MTISLKINLKKKVGDEPMQIITNVLYGLSAW